MAIGYTDRAHVISFGEKQLQYHPAIFAQAVTVGYYFHALHHLGGASRQQLIIADNLHQTQPSGTNVINALQMTQGRKLDPRVSAGIKNARSLLGGNRLVIDG